MKEKIIEATIRVFNQKGLKFTMDDIAKELSMSKKTIYTVFEDKESLLFEMVDYCFDKIKESEDAVLSDETLSKIIEKEFDFRPLAIIEKLDLRKPVYKQTASYGHFGRKGFSWEQTDRAEELKAKYLK